MRAIKELGQNFITNPTLAQKIVDASNPCKQDTYLEIGPGKGALTDILAPRVKHLICVEKDLLMCELIKNRFSDQAHVQFIPMNILEFNAQSYIHEEYKVIGSLPFNISKKIITLFAAQQTHKPISMTFVIQKEVAEKYIVSPPIASYLSNFIQLYADCEIVFNIKSGNFKPKPKVDASLIRFTPKPPPKNHQKLAHFMRAIFQHPRKTLKNNLRSIVNPEQLDLYYPQFIQIVDLQKRPSEVYFEEILDLFLVYNKSKSNET
ncbi:MAG: 16S rRNA (adenine(1518)-N(6)/adenine(1519)-N(6))-dimethyltransferase RsmA [Patescibacteria group bacterium]|nr:16S rRNA (adenine(1518)-N(6)/adenine(1519)-N(6))-dimethyltransferase RsmA [Patescibacteria group bacterium]